MPGEHGPRAAKILFKFVTKDPLGGTLQYTPLSFVRGANNNGQRLLE